MEQDKLLAQIESLRRRVSELEARLILRELDEDGLRVSEVRYRQAVEKSPDAIMAMDATGRILSWNRACTEITGYLSEEALGRDYSFVILNPEWSYFTSAVLSRVFQGESFSDLELDFRCSDGSVRSMMSRAYPVRDRHDRVVECILANTAVTRLKCGEEILLQEQGRLEQLVQQRTADLARTNARLTKEIDERKTAEASLRRGEERLSLALDGANLGIWDWDLTTGKAVLTERTLKMLGYQADDLATDLKTWKRLIHPDDWPKVSENLNIHLEGGVPLFEVEYRILDKLQTWHWLQARGKVVAFDAAGRPTRMTGIVVDITNRKKAEEALSASEERYRALFDNAPVGIFQTDSRGQTRFVNPHMAKLVAAESPEEAVAHFKQLSRQLYADPQRRDDFIRILREEGEITNFEYEAVRVDGSHRWFSMNARVSELCGDGSFLIEGFTVDITERKQTAEALREREQQYRLLADNTLDVIWQTDLDLRFTYVNPAIFRVTGHTPDELIGTRLTEHCDEENFMKMAQVASEEISKGPNHSGAIFEAVMFKKNKEPISVEIHGRVILGEDGLPIALQGVTRDITERKRADEKLRQAAQLLTAHMDNSPLAVIEFDPQLRVIRWSPEAERIFGWASEEIVGRSISETRWVYDEDKELVGRESAGLLSGERSRSLNVNRNYRKDGSVIHCEWYNSAIYDSGGKLVSILSLVRDCTERKNTEEALRSSENAYKTLAENIPGIVYRVHFDGQPTMEFFNNAIETITGYSGGDLKSGEVCSIDPLILSEDRPKVVELVKQAFDENRPFEIEYRIRDKNGAIRHLLEYGKPIRGVEGSRSYIDGVIFDISERKRAEEALQESMELMQYIVRNDPNAIAVYDRDLHYLAVSNRYLLDYNVKEEDIIGKHHYEVFPEMPQRWKDVHQRCLMGAVESEDDDYFDRPDGSITYNRWECRPWYRSSGEIGGIITYTEVTTERKMAEKALKESEARYRHLFDNSPVGIISVDTEGWILEVNRPLLEILDSPSTAATKRINMFELPQLVESGVSDAFRSCMTTDERALKEFPYVSKWGKQSHLRIVLTPVTDEEQTILGCQATVEDITKQRILEDQLRQAQKMEAVGTLAGGIAHDFNNLLHIISGHAELLDMELDERKLKFGELDAIRQAARRGADLVKQILTFSRRIDAKFESINLNEEVRSTERLLYRTIPKMIEIDLRLEEGLDRVRADSTQIEQMLINLAVNAKDAMPEGGRLAIETRNVNLDEHYCQSHAEIVPGRYVLLTVSDTGHGMEEDVRQHIFEPFFTTKGLADGTGLGLATVFGIVKMHGGHITCESEVGKGTTFSMYFPAVEAAKSEVVGEQEVFDVARGTETILVVDDEPMIRDLAKRILDRSGYSVLTAGSGKEGIEIYAQHKSEISLVILDLIMPEMGGKQCLEELLKINPQVKALIASGFAVKGDTKVFLDTEAKGIVPKPFNMRELLRSVRHVLDGR